MSMKIYELVNDSTRFMKAFEDRLMQKIRVAAPARVTSVDFEKQTLNAQITIRENVDGQLFGIPELLDVPFFIIGGGDFSMTFPIKEGDECLVVFADSCIDSWWQNGDVQNPIDERRHDLSDGFALVGFKSQKNRLENISDEAFQIRQGEDAPLEISDDAVTIKKGDVEIEVKEDGVTISTDEDTLIKIDSDGTVTVKASTIKLDGTVKINDKDFMSHVHTGGNQGANTGGVVA